MEKPIEGFGVLTNAPIFGDEGYGFLEMDSGISVYIPRHVIAGASVSRTDLGERFKVRAKRVEGTDKYEAMQLGFCGGGDLSELASEEVSECLSSIQLKQIEITKMQRRIVHLLRLNFVLESKEA